MSFTYEKNSDLRLMLLKLPLRMRTREGLNLDLMYAFYSIEKIVQLVNWNEK